MLNYIWSAIVIVSIICSVICGNTHELSSAVIDSGAAAIELLMTMAGVMCIWSGIMKIAEQSGFTSIIAKIFSPMLRLLFPNLDPDGETFGSITMNISANLLGLGNTATPFGLKAMQGLNRINGENKTASDEMIIFVVMNTASLQLLPTMLGTLRQTYGSKAPFEIMTCVWISSACALAVALILAVGINKTKFGRK
jgi:spore maturation protein A